MNSRTKSIIELQGHCWQLSCTLSSLWQRDLKSFARGDEILNYGDAAGWLDLAACVCKVDVLTGKFDDSLMMCGRAREYEDARSELLSRLTTQLTVFSFAWGAFETVAKIVNPPSIPSDHRTNGANGLIDRTIFQLKDFTPVPAYSEVLEQLSALVKHYPQYDSLLKSGTLPAHIGTSGIGIDFVRRVRNRFAHGTAHLPLPDNCPNGWCGERSREPDLIGLSTRIVLLTTQMALAVQYAGEHFDLRVLDDEDGFTMDADVHVVLGSLHLVEAQKSS